MARKPGKVSARFKRDPVIGAKSTGGQSSGPAGRTFPRKQAEDMTAPETFAKPLEKELASQIWTAG
jgi:hypothetical protein